MNRIAGSGCEVLIPLGEKKPLKEIERSLTKTYKKDIWTKFNKAVNDYKLIQDGDRVAVAISGGKDSLLMAKLFQELKRHGRVRFDAEFIAMDPGYYDSNRTHLINNCRHLDIPVQIFETDIFEVIDDIASDYPCYLCARMRRGHLYAKAQELKCNKLALGHHFDDVIETTLLNMLYAGSFKTMRPKLKAKNFEGLELIRPLYYIHEEAIKRYTVSNGIAAMNCGCVVAAQKTSSKRREIKQLIKSLKRNFADVDKCIFQSAQNVNLDSVLGWEKGGKKYSYLDFYDEE